MPDVTSLAERVGSLAGGGRAGGHPGGAPGGPGRLRPEEREVLTLVAWEDLTAADAARVLGMPAGTARRLLHQARTALRNAPEVAALLTDLNSVKESQ